MLKKDFNHEWTCRPLSREGEKIPVTLPYDAMRTEKRTPESMGEGNIGWFEGGDYEYEKVLTLSAGDLKTRMVLEFETVYHGSQVWIG
ncbi:MAG: glycoside hydrolase family 2, partial [Lachnospiraceae bacterium]|nr:glycoside hydrolase family 2 [Lachnospiraceae bacterium]